MALQTTLNSPAKIPTRKRSNKRTRRDFVQEEYLAMCLVKLARRTNEVIKRPTVKSIQQDNIALTTFLKSLQVQENSLSATMDVKKHQEEPTTHRCNLCNKSFSSHQALGGHKGTHRTNPRPLIVKFKSSEKVHECSTCHKTFGSGQALGGHMRKHYEGVIVVSANKNNPSNSDQNIRDLDLNVAFTEEDLYRESSTQTAF